MNELLNKVSPIELSELEELEIKKSGRTAVENIDSISDISIELVVRLGRKKMTIGDACQLAVGSILEVEKKAGHKVDIYLDNQHAGIGEVILVEENFGIVISDILNYQKKRVKGDEHKAIPNGSTSTGE